MKARLDVTMLHDHEYAFAAGMGMVWETGTSMRYPCIGGALIAFKTTDFIETTLAPSPRTIVLALQCHLLYGAVYVCLGYVPKPGHSVS